MASDITLSGTPSWVSGPNGWNAVQMTPTTASISNATTQPGDVVTVEIQTITLNDGPAWGNWHITGNATALAHNASAGDVQGVLDTLLGSSVVTVSRSGAGSSGDPYVYTIEWILPGDQTQLVGVNDSLGSQIGVAAAGAPVNFCSMGAFTWCYWMRLDSNVDGKYLLSKDNGSHSGSDIAHINGFATTGVSNLYTPSAGVQNVYTIPDSGWHFYLWTYDGSNTVLYVDGGAAAATIGGALSDSGADLFIGGENFVNANSAITISQMRTYSAALGSTDRSTLAAAGEVSTNRIGRWLFSEGSGTTVAMNNGTDHALTATFNATVSATATVKANAHLDATFNAVGSATAAVKANAHLDATFNATATATAPLNTGEQLSAAASVSPNFSATLTGGTPISSGNKLISPYAVY